MLKIFKFYYLKKKVHRGILIEKCPNCKRKLFQNSDEKQVNVFPEKSRSKIVQG